MIKDKRLLKNINVIEMKLIGGESMLAQLMDQDNNFLYIVNPMTIKVQSVEDDSGIADYRYYVHSMPFSVQPDFAIAKYNVLMYASVTDDCKDMYIEMVTTTPKGVNPLPKDELDSDIEEYLDNINPTLH